MATAKENLLRAARFEQPDYIHMSIGVMPACWDFYPQDAMQDLMEGHPLLFPTFKRSSERIIPNYAPWRRADAPFLDSWGCVWETNRDGFTGAVVKRPFQGWDEFAGYTPPDPDEQSGWVPIDWGQVGLNVGRARAEGQLARGSLRHGHTFLTLSYIRGYQELIYDMADEEPRLWDLIHMVETFNLGIVERYVALGVEWMGYPEDLGTQSGPLVSPAWFRKFIKPTYQRLMAPARQAGCVIHMHSDGDVRTLAEDLIECGVQVLNLQDLVNGIDWIAENLKGRICINLDIDRQNIIRFGTPPQVEAHIREAVIKLGSREGGLTMNHGLVPGIPLENVKAMMDAMEQYAFYYA